MAYEVMLHATDPNEIMSGKNDDEAHDDRMIEFWRDHKGKTALMLKAEMEIEHAKSEFQTYSQVYEAGEPWQPITPLRQLNDDMFSGYWLDEKV